MRFRIRLASIPLDAVDRWRVEKHNSSTCASISSCTGPQPSARQQERKDIKKRVRRHQHHKQAQKVNKKGRNDTRTCNQGIIHKHFNTHQKGSGAIRGGGGRSMRGKREQTGENYLKKSGGKREAGRNSMFRDPGTHSPSTSSLHS